MPKYRLVDVERLFSDLRVAAAPLSASLSAEDVGPATRHTAALQIRVLLQLLRHLGQPEEDSHALKDLLGALADLENGKATALLKPVEFGRGNRPMSAKRRAVLTFAAAVLTLHVRRGKREKSAAAQIIRELDKHNALPESPRRTDTPGYVSLMEWRRSLESGRAHSDNVQQYKEILTEYQNADPAALLHALIDASSRPGT